MTTHRTADDAIREAGNISVELAAGIRSYYDDITAIGGFGARVRTTMPNGVIAEGVLGEGGSCQPIITSDDGRRFVVMGPISRIAPIIVTGEAEGNR